MLYSKPFTDDDLAGVKEGMELGLSDEVKLRYGTFKALLARMEAGEQRAAYLHKTLFTSMGVFDPLEYERLSEAWHKACGK